MDHFEIIGSVLLVPGIALGIIFIFFPREKLLKNNLKPLADGTFNKGLAVFGPKHRTPFWMLNSYGKFIRGGAEISLLVSFILLNISYWFY